MSSVVSGTRNGDSALPTGAATDARGLAATRRNASYCPRASITTATTVSLADGVRNTVRPTMPIRARPSTSSGVTVSSSGRPSRSIATRVGMAARSRTAWPGPAAPPPRYGGR